MQLLKVYPHCSIREFGTERRGGRWEMPTVPFAFPHRSESQGVVIKKTTFLYHGSGAGAVAPSQFQLADLGGDA